MRGEPSAMRCRTRLRTPFARPAATATVRARTVSRTSVSTNQLSAGCRGSSVERAEQGTSLKGNFDPGAFACLHEKTCADQVLDDAGGGVRRDVERALDVLNG